ncbi:MAG: hypothetical protein WC741_03070 [Patescibacteria group bacterium]|jgi:hypothetical protein
MAVIQAKEIKNNFGKIVGVALSLLFMSVPFISNLVTPPSEATHSALKIGWEGLANVLAWGFVGIIALTSNNKAPVERL